MRKQLLLFGLLVIITPVSLLSQPATSQPDPQFQQQYQAGVEALNSGKNKDAVDALKRALKLASNPCVECYLDLAIAYTRLGDLSKAVENCDRAADLASDNSTKAEAHALKGKVLLTITPANDKWLRQAEQEFRTSLQLDENNPLYHYDLAVTLLRQSKDPEASEQLKSCLALDPPAAIAERARLMLADPRRGREQFAPNFHLTSLQGQDISLKDLTGRIVVLDFWATWCPPCRASVGELRELTRKYSNDKVVVISVSADESENAWREFVARHEMQWPQYRDADSRMRQSFAVHSFPTYLVIDGDGIIRQRIVGMNPTETVVYRLKTTLAAMPQLEGVQKK